MKQALPRGALALLALAVGGAFFLTTRGPCGSSASSTSVAYSRRPGSNTSSTCHTCKSTVTSHRTLSSSLGVDQGSVRSGGTLSTFFSAASRPQGDQSVGESTTDNRELMRRLEALREF